MSLTKWTGDKVSSLRKSAFNRAQAWYEKRSGSKAADFNGWPIVIAASIGIAMMCFLFLSVAYRIFWYSSGGIGGPMNWPWVLLAIIIAAIFSALAYSTSKMMRKGHEDEKTATTWWERFVTKNPESDGLPRAVVLMAIFMFLIQWILYIVEFGPWTAVWEKQNLFWAFQMTILGAFTGQRLTKNNTVKWMMRASIFVVIAVWATMWYGPNSLRSILRRGDGHTPPPVVYVDPGTVEKIVVKKGQSVGFEVAEIVSVDAIPLLVRLNEEGPYLKYEPGTLDTLASSTRLVELMSKEKDFTVTVRKPPKG